MFDSLIAFRTSGWHDRCTIKWATFNRTYGDTSYHLIQILQRYANKLKPACMVEGTRRGGGRWGLGGYL